MNIFVLNLDPEIAAQEQCDKHVVKMPLETAQLLCSVFPNGEAPYKRTHYNHPCAIWTRTSRQNYAWLIRHGLALCKEYTFRYGKTHASEKVIVWCQENVDKLTFETEGLTAHPMAMPEECKTSNVVESYRSYYKHFKKDIAVWKNKPNPSWWV